MPEEQPATLILAHSQSLKVSDGFRERGAGITSEQQGGINGLTQCYFAGRACSLTAQPLEAAIAQPLRNGER
jgi:hypothetical protein